MRINFTRLLSLVFTLSFAALASLGQTMQVIPPPPSSAAIERYSDYPVSMFTGVPDISIPVYEIKSGDLSLPITISYHASGIKADDNSYPVGVGWSLNAGGRVSRTIRDKADERHFSITEELLESFHHQAPVNYEPTLAYLDTEPDVFSYSFGIANKSSGRFIFDPQKRPSSLQLSGPAFFPQANIRLDYFNKNEKTLGLTDADGVAYKFGGNSPGNKAFEYASFSAATDVSAWLCTEVMPASKNVKDKITFTYQPGTQVINSYSFYGKMELIDSIIGGGTVEDDQTYPEYLITAPGDRIKITNLNNPNWHYMPQSVSYDVTQVRTIRFNGGTVQFDYGGGNILHTITVLDEGGHRVRTAKFYSSPFPFTGNLQIPRIKLDSVVFRNANEVKEFSYKFDYLNAQVQTLTGRDFWRYYNGQDMLATTAIMPVWENVPAVSFPPIKDPENSAYPIMLNWESNFYKRKVRIGNHSCASSELAMKSFLLRKITLPTGGYSEYDFEANKYKDSTGALVDVGGLRVKQIRTYPADGSVLIKKYLYGKNRDGAGIPVKIPAYDDFITTVYQELGETANDIMAIRKRTFFSQPLQELSYVDGSPVWYTQVEEFTENGQTGARLGKSFYHYQLPPPNVSGYFDFPEHSLRGTKYIRLINGYNFPQLIAKKIYKTEAGMELPVSASRYAYYGLESHTFRFYPVSVFWQVASWGYIGGSQYAQRSMVHGESFLSNLSFVMTGDTTITYTHNANGGLDSAMLCKAYEYNGVYPFPSAVSVKKSTGETLVTRTKYALDYAAYDLAQGYHSTISASDELSNGIRSLIVNNVVTAPVEEVTELWKNDVKTGVLAGKLYTYSPLFPQPVKLYRTAFSDPSAAFAVSELSGGGVLADPAYQLFQQMSYTPGGRLSGVRHPAGTATAFLWGYDDRYPVAEIKNATENEVSYSGFEEAALPYFNGQRSNGKARSGQYSVKVTSSGPYQVSSYPYNGLSVNLAAAKKFRYSGWVFSEGPSARLCLMMRNSGETAAFSYLDHVLLPAGHTGQWVYLEQEFLVPASVKNLDLRLDNNGSGNVWFDDLRLCPSEASMRTFTYQPLSGLSSVTDSRNQTTTYDYDSFQRLKAIKDSQGNVIRSNEYHYQP